MPSPRSAVRIFGIVARNARRAVLFRRGPSKRVLVLNWDLETDRITPGQWLKGRIYERRCDLSPSGELLVYFAAKHRGEPPTWTAVSKVPYLTALAFFPKRDSYGGGGLFESERVLRLNHFVLDVAADGSPLTDANSSRRVRPVTHPRSTRVGPLTIEALDQRFFGEDFPICGARMERDGWTPVQRSSRPLRSDGALRWSFDPPWTWRRRGPSKQSRDLTLELRFTGYGLRNGPGYVTEYSLRDAKSGAQVVDYGRHDWIDWDHNGELLIASHGRLYRLDPNDDVSLDAAREVIDLHPMKFEQREAPAWAKRW